MQSAVWLQHAESVTSWGRRWSLNIRETSFLEESTSCPGNVVPGNVLSGNRLSGKVPVRETTVYHESYAFVRETSVREMSCPGIYYMSR